MVTRVGATGLLLQVRPLRFGFLEEVTKERIVDEGSLKRTEKSWKNWLKSWKEKVITN
jgi:hypothetical protein